MKPYEYLIALSASKALGRPIVPVRLLPPLPYAAKKLRSFLAGRRLLLTVYQSEICAICGESTRGQSTSIDHVVPQKLGGKEKRNLLMAHTACNHAKGHRMPTGCELIWLDMVTAKIEQPILSHAAQPKPA